MKLVTFHSAGPGDRIGAVTQDGSIVDLNAAYALYLRNFIYRPAGLMARRRGSVISSIA
jgi:hypothetical protein